MKSKSVLEEAGKTSAVAQFISERIDALSHRKNQKDIAREAGLPNANVITMFKKGETPFPLARVIAFAKALEVDPAELFQLTLLQLYPDPAENPVEQIFGGIIPNKDEAEIIKAYRKLRAPKFARDAKGNVEDERLPKIETAMRAALAE